MNKALRFVWLSLLTLFCGVASAGTVVFDPATDVSSGTSLTKDGVTITMTSGTSSFAATDYNGTLSYAFKQKTYFEFTTGESVKINSVSFEYQSAGGYIYDRNNNTSSTEFEGGKTYTVKGEGASSLLFSVFSGPMYFSKITVECTGGDEPGGGEVGTTYSIDDLMTGAADVASATLKFTDAQVVYGDGTNYIVREGGKAIDLMGTSLSLEKGATLNGTVTMNVTYKNGFLKAEDVAGVTNGNKLTQTNATGENVPVTATIEQLGSNYKGDLVLLSQVNIYNDSYGDLGQGAAYYARTGFTNFATLTNIADFLDKVSSDQDATYDIVAWYNEPGAGAIKAKLQIVEFLGGEVAKPAAPVISGNQNFTGSTEVTITAEEGATIFYTTDGTAPTSWDPAYTAPFTITETTTVKAVTAYLDDYSDIVTKTFTKVGDFETKTIAQLFEGQQAVENVTISLNNAKVVYTEKHDDGTKVAILRENGQALDVISGVLDLPLGSTVTGTFFASVDFNGGIFTTRDVQGETNSYELEYTMPSDEGYNDPIETTVADVHLYPGDLVSIKGLQVLGQDGQYYGFTEDYSFVNLTDNDELANTVSGQKYTVLGWFNAPGTGFADGNASLKAVKLTAEDATKYHNQTIAELNVRRDREDNIRLVLDNAKVVYVRANPYYGTKDIALRQDGKAVVLYNSTLPLELNSTVSGTVKLDFYALAGIPQLREIDGGVTTADSLNITAGASQEVDPVEVTMANYDEHRADVIVLRQVKIVYGSQAAYAIEKDGQKIAFKNENEDVDVDALVSNDNLYDVVLWYNGYINEAPEMEFVNAVKVTDVGIYGVEADYGKDGNTYNLQGVKVGKNYRGVVIRDGKKFTKK